MAVIVELTEYDRLHNHIPEDVWVLSRTQAVYIKDGVTDELVQVLDCLEEEAEDD